MLKSTQKHFGIADRVSRAELAAVGVDTTGMSVDEKMRVERQNIFAVPTGEFRCPRKGEWYLSGAIVCAYKAGGNFTSKYHIARLVARRLVVTETYVPY